MRNLTSMEAAKIVGDAGFARGVLEGILDWGEDGKDNPPVQNAVRYLQEIEDIICKLIDEDPPDEG